MKRSFIVVLLLAIGAACFLSYRLRNSEEKHIEVRSKEGNAELRTKTPIVQLSSLAGNKESSTAAGSPAADDGAAKDSRLSISKLRSALLQGNWERFRDVNGALEESDAVDLHGMLSEIPSDLKEAGREQFRLRLVQLLNCIPGNLSSSLLLEFAANGEVSAESDSWMEAVTILGYRHYKDASDFLEGAAYGDDYKAWTVASKALMLIDAGKYMNRTGQAMLSNPNAATHYLSAIGSVAVGHEGLDLGSVIPALQELFMSDHEQAHQHRPLIAEILQAHAANHKDSRVGKWLADSLRSILQSPDGKYSSEERARHQAVLSKLKN